MNLNHRVDLPSVLIVYKITVGNIGGKIRVVLGKSFVDYFLALEAILRVFNLLGRARDGK